MKRQAARLTKGSVGATLLRLTLPMVIGVFAIFAFNLADTYFVAQLGTRELAAMTFTFPIVMVLGGIALGLGTGTASVVARAIGEGNPQHVRRLASDSLLLALCIVAVLAFAGLLTINPMFRLLGATEELLPLIRRYMRVWYPGMVFVVVPMVGNNAIRATGDTRFPSLVMVVGALVNVVLDPILIFGLAGFPRLDLAGAAIATVVARSTTCVAALMILHFRERMLDFSVPSGRDFLRSCRAILSVGGPAAGTAIINPLGAGLVTRIAAGLGATTVAAMGAGMRVATFALVPVIALSTALVPFVGQNWGAANLARVDRARRHANLLAMGWGVVCVCLMISLAGLIARQFGTDAEVVHRIRLFLWIVPLGFALQGICIVSGAFLNAINRPLISAAFGAARVFMFYVPLAWAGCRIGQAAGLFGGMACGDCFAGILALLWARRISRAALEGSLAAEGEEGWKPQTSPRGEGI